MTHVTTTNSTKTGSLNIHMTHVTANNSANTGSLNIHMTHLTDNNSTNYNVLFFFGSGLKIVYYNNY